MKQYMEPQTRTLPTAESSPPATRRTADQNDSGRCPAGRCEELSLEADHFLADVLAPICWDCPLVTRKIRL